MANLGTRLVKEFKLIPAGFLSDNKDRSDLDSGEGRLEAAIWRLCRLVIVFGAGEEYVVVLCKLWSASCPQARSMVMDYAVQHQQVIRWTGAEAPCTVMFRRPGLDGAILSHKTVWLGLVHATPRQICTRIGSI